MIKKDPKIHVEAWGKLFSKNVMEGIEFPVGRTYEDLATTFRYFLKSKDLKNKISFSNLPLYFYRNNPESITHTVDLKKFEDSIYTTLYRFSYLCNIEKNYALAKLASEQTRLYFEWIYSAYPNLRFKCTKYLMQFLHTPPRILSFKKKVKLLGCFISPKLFFAIKNKNKKKISHATTLIFHHTHI